MTNFTYLVETGFQRKTTDILANVQKQCSCDKALGRQQCDLVIEPQRSQREEVGVVGQVNKMSD